MIELAEQIPATFWGVVAGSIFSILGVWLTNRSSDKRLLKQFDHEREASAKEREMTLKKDVYLAASEAIFTGISVIGNFSNFELNEQEVIKASTEKSSVIAKVHVIGSFETIRAISNLSNELSSIYLTLFSERAKIAKDKVEKDILLKSINDYARQRDSTLEMMKQYNLDGLQDPKKWNVLQSNYQFDSDFIQRAVVEHGELNKKFFQKQLIFMRRCVQFSQQASALVPQLLISVRKELDLPLDQEAYLAALNEGISRQLTAIDSFVEEFSSYL